MLKKFKNIFTVLTSVCALVSASTGFSQTSPLSRENLQSKLEKAVMCDVNALNNFGGSAFDGGLNDPKLQLEKLGVKVSDLPWDDGDIKYVFPPGVKVFGYEAKEAVWSARSTTIFFIKLHAGINDLKSINKTLRLTPIPKGNPDGYGFFNEFDVHYIRKLTVDKDIPPDTIFSGVGISENYIVIGCQNLAW